MSRHILSSHLELVDHSSLHCCQFTFISLEKISIIPCALFANFAAVTAGLLNINAVTCCVYFPEMGRLQTELETGRVRWGGDAIRPL